jgi:acylphosphatase
MSTTCADGTVEIVAEGETAPLQTLLDWAKVGPPAAQVTQTEVTWADADRRLCGFYHQALGP